MEVRYRFAYRMPNVRSGVDFRFFKSQLLLFLICSIIWSGFVTSNHTGFHTLTVSLSGGDYASLWIAHQNVLNQTSQSITSAQVYLSAGLPP